MKEYYIIARNIAKITKKMLSMLLMLLFCGCNINKESDLLVAIYIFPTYKRYTDYYFEIKKDKIIECTRGLARDDVDDMIDGKIDGKKDIKPGVENFISNEVHMDEIIDYEHLEWVRYSRRQEISYIDSIGWERLDSCLSQLTKKTPGNIFQNAFWKPNNAGVVVMYKGNIYTFWYYSDDETEKSFCRCLEEISPIKIAIPDKEKRPEAIIEYLGKVETNAEDEE